MKTARYTDEDVSAVGVAQSAAKGSSRSRAKPHWIGPLNLDLATIKTVANGLTMVDRIKRQTAKRKAALEVDVSRASDLSPSTIEHWVYGAKRGMLAHPSPRFAGGACFCAG